MPRSNLSPFVVALLFCSASCEKAVEDGIPPQAVSLCEQGEYDEMIPLLKDYLLRNPNDAAAHFYLGRGYLHSPDSFRPEHAKGEFRTALNLFLRNGKQSPIDGFSSQYFEMMCHIERAKVPLRLIRESLGLAAWLWMLTPYLEECLEECKPDLEAAREIAPESKDVKDLEELIKIVSDIIGEGRRPPRQASVGFHI